MRGQRISLSCVAVATLTVAALAAAQEFELAPVVGPVRPGERPEGVEVLVGLMAGIDSNPGRAASGTETSDVVGEAFAGLAASRGNSRLGCRISAEARAVRFADQEESNWEEGLVGVHAGWTSRRLRLAMNGRLALMADPVDAEALSFGVLERQVLSYAPEVSFLSGRSELGISYRGESVEHALQTFRHLDRRDAAVELELCRRAEGGGRYFARFDSGGVDYDIFDPASPRYDFDRQMACVGWRMSTPRGSAFEIALGAEEVESGDFGDESGLYVSVRSARALERNNSVLEAAYIRRVEASATADFKTASRLMLRYSRAASSRLRWSATLRSESSDLTNPDDPSDDSLYNLGADIGLERFLGSPSGWHGRFDIKVGFESSDLHERLRVLAGIALAR